MFRHLSIVPILLALTPVLGSAPVYSAALSARADSTAVEEMVVSGKIAATVEGGSTRVSSREIQLQNPGSLADLGSILPSVRVASNSRGDSHLMIRGAPERHVQTFLDGIPLNLPWDERVDLETIPITGIGRLESRRGLSTLLDGPGVLAGSVRILPPALEDRPRGARLDLSLGSGSRVRANLSGFRRQGEWTLLGAGGWQSRDHFPVANTGSARFNSDLKQLSLLGRASRSLGNGGRLNLLATVWGGEKGVPPERHLGNEARFWRYPLRSRTLVGGSVNLPFADNKWDAHAMLAADFYRQEIDPRGPDNWDTPLINGQDYEKSFDRTGHFTGGLNRWFAHHSRLSLQSHLRYTQHRESVTVGGGVQSYSQLLGGVVLEGEYYGPAGLMLRLGAGMDAAATPESGDKDQAEGFTAPAFSLHASRPAGYISEIYATASRRSRFPSLRELYSGALGRFVPNGDLVPEEQDLLEVGLAHREARWQLSASAFLQYLHQGIEKISLGDPERRFMRVNRTEIRVPGLEIDGSWDLARSWRLTAQHTILKARVETAHGFDQPAEDRPDYLSRIGLENSPLRGLGIFAAATVTGARWSADAGNAETGLSRLPAHMSWDLRLRWRWEGQQSDPSRSGEVFLLVQNLFDQRGDYQTGLPTSGRVVSVGGSVGY